MFKLRREQMEAFRPVVRAQVPHRVLTDLCKQGVPAERDPKTGEVVVTDPRGFQTRLRFYPDGLPARVTKPSGSTYHYEHDKEGRLAAVTYPGGERVEIERDSRGNLTRLERPELLAYSFEYNDENRPTTVKYPDGTEERFFYHHSGALESSIDRGGAKTTYRRSPDGALLAVVDPLGRETTYLADEEGKLDSVVFPDGSRQEYAFDPDSDTILALTRDGRGVVQEHREDGAVSAISWEDGTRVDLDFSGDNLIGVANEHGKITADFDSEGNPIKENLHWGVVRYVYDPEGRLGAIEYPSGEIVQYGYDAEGRTSSIRDWQGRESRIVYREDGAIAEIHYANGLTERQTPSRTGRQEHVQVVDRHGKLLSEQAYRYDLMGRLVAVADSSDGRSGERRERALEYDLAGRLQREVDPGSRRTLNRYSYDAKGNLIEDSGKAIEVGLLDEPIRYAGQPVTYDQNGNVIRMPGPRSELLCNFGADSTLREVTSGQQRVVFKYDGLGRRILKTDGVYTYRYTWAENSLISEEFQENPSAEFSRRDYLYFPSTASPLAFRENGQTYWLQSDCRGAVIRAFDEGGSVVWLATYDSFGVATVEVSAVRQPWRLAGQYEDGETGLYYNFARYYCPWLKTYLSRDPNWHQYSAHNYSYAANDPWNQIDTNGTWPEFISSAADAIKSFGQAVKSVVNDPSFWKQVGEYAVDVAVVAGGVALGVLAAPIIAGAGLTAGAAALAAGAVAVVGGALLTFGGEVAKQAMRGDGFCLSCAFNEALGSGLLDLLFQKFSRLGKLIPKSLRKAIAQFFKKAAAKGRKLFTKLARKVSKAVKGKLDDLLARLKRGKAKKPLPAELRKPKPNSVYNVNGYTYKTDGQGRVVEVSGRLKRSKAKRNANQQRLVGKSGKKGDEGGHLIGSRFGGHGDRINLVPQNANLNRGAWKKMENEWSAALNAKPPKKVDVVVRPMYDKGATRPSAFRVKYTIDGKIKNKYFENMPGGGS